MRGFAQWSPGRNVLIIIKIIKKLVSGRKMQMCRGSLKRDVKSSFAVEIKLRRTSKVKREEVINDRPLKTMGGG